MTKKLSLALLFAFALPCNGAKQTRRKKAFEETKKAKTWLIGGAATLVAAGVAFFGYRNYVDGNKDNEGNQSGKSGKSNSISARQKRKEEEAILKKYKGNNHAGIVDAARKGNLKVVKVLAKHTPKSIGEALLWAVGRANNEETVEFLLTMDPDQPSIDHALPWGVKKVGISMARLLTPRASSEARNKTLEIAVEHGKFDVMKFLLGENENKKMYVTDQSTINSSMIDAATYNQLKTVQYLLYHKKVTDEYTISRSLISAITKANTDIVKFLVKKNNKGKAYVTDQYRIAEALDEAKSKLKEENSNKQAYTEIIQLLQKLTLMS